MGNRLQRITAVALALLWSLPSLPAHGSDDGDFLACWVSEERVAGIGAVRHITICRVAGGSTVTYASDQSIPKTLYPDIGVDATGACWYLTSRPTGFVILDRQADGSVTLGLPSADPDFVIMDSTYPRCTSEPDAAASQEVSVWDYVISYIHDPPLPDVNPRPGDGITGMTTYVGVPIPDRHQATLSGGSALLEVEIEVATVNVDWGDGTIRAYPAKSGALAGYPNGTAQHIYQAKTEGRAITVAYVWAARWRTSGGSWQVLAVPETASSVTYPVAEIVAVLQP